MRKFLLGFSISLLLSSSVFAGSVTLFCASSTKFAMEEVKKAFLEENKGDAVELIFGASGKGYAQYSNGAPYEIFMAANNGYAQKIIDDGKAASQRVVYAKGAIAFYSTDSAITTKGIEGLLSDNVKKISIANPKLAPYGVAAVEILTNYGIYDAVSSKIVMGDNISQTLQFVDTKSADAGFVALSLIKGKEGGVPSENYFVIDATKYNPIEQSMVLTVNGKENPLAKKFFDFIMSQKGAEIFEKYGFAR